MDLDKRLKDLQYTRSILVQEVQNLEQIKGDKLTEILKLDGAIRELTLMRDEEEKDGGNSQESG